MMETAVAKRMPALQRLAQALSEDRQERLSREACQAVPLEEQLRRCLYQMRQNQMHFDLETEPELIDALIYEYQAIQSRYRYYQRMARAQGLRAIL